MPSPQDIVFTSGGTESVNQAIKGVAFSQREKGRHIITTNIEHKSVLNTLRTLRLVDYKITSLDVDSHGLVDPAAVEKAITDETILITIQMANNEIGTDPTHRRDRQDRQGQKGDFSYRCRGCRGYHSHQC